MSLDVLPDTAVAEPIELSAATTPARPGLLGKLWKMPVFFWKWLVGAVLCLNPLGSVLVVGWTYRLAQRSVLKQWWKRSQLRPEGVSFAEFLDGSDETRKHAHWPNWIIQPKVQSNLWQSAPQRMRFWGQVIRLFRWLGGSLWLNLRIGVQGIFNSWVLTLPACLLWLFAWHAGWNNSFHKGYEQFWVGPLTGWLGIMWFIGAMLYLPMAQVRQAATGQWRAFYEFRLVRQLVRRRWLACLGLAALYSAISVPVSVLKTAPAFFAQMMPNSVEMTDGEIVQLLRRYFFWACLAVFPAYVLLRLAAARIYASALLATITDGAVPAIELGEGEHAVLARLDLLRQRPQTPRHLLLRAVGWSGGRLARAAGILAVLLVWFSFVAQIFISEFLNYHPGIGWLNQPLVQLPWFNYMPAHLSTSTKNAASSDRAAVAAEEEAMLDLSPIGKRWGTAATEDAIIAKSTLPLLCCAPNLYFAIYGAANHAEQDEEVAAPSESSNWREWAVLRGHEGAVFTLALSPDGSLLATGSEDATVKLWDVMTGEERATLRGHTNPIVLLRFTPDGKTLVTMSESLNPCSPFRFTEVKLWDVTAGQERATLGVFPGAITSFTLSPDGKTLATGVGEDHRPTMAEVLLGVPANPPVQHHQPGQVKLWDVETGDELTTLEGHEREVRAAVYSHDGKILATWGAFDSTVKLWDMPAGQLRATLQSQSEAFGSMSFSPDGRTLVTGGGQWDEPGEVKLWDVVTGREGVTIQKQTGPVQVIFSPDGSTLVTLNESWEGADDDLWDGPGEMRFWDVATWQVRALHRNPLVSFAAAEFSADGKMLATLDEHGTVRLWDIATGKQQATLEGDSNIILGNSAISADRMFVAAPGQGGTVKVWRVSPMPCPSSPGP